MSLRSVKVYVVIINWNGWKDTIECLESVFRNSYESYGVIVCDNYSADGSLDRIKEWADGTRMSSHSPHKEIRKFTSPPIQKPVQYVEYKSEQVRNNVRRILDAPLILIQADGNLGFAGGNNLGIAYALKEKDCGYVWLLNNDTVVHADALKYLVKYGNEHPTIGICGSKLLFYDTPEKVQALGGSYNRFFSATTHITEEENLKKMDYVVGASMLVSRSFLEEVGPMSEEYFLYFEELDWAMRGGRKFQSHCVMQSKVFHKEGATISKGQDKRGKSFTADYYGIRNRILFSKKYYPRYLPSVYFGLFISIAKRIRRGQFDRALMILRLMMYFIGRDSREKINVFRDLSFRK